MTEKIDPIRPTDDEARALARSLLQAARFGALAVRDPDSGMPHVSRVAVGTVAGVPLMLVSGLSHHTRALRQDPACSLLVGEPGPKGDPLTHPRLTLLARAGFVEHDSPEFAALRGPWLALNPKSKLYIDFGDFSFVRLDPVRAHLNGGFGRAFVLEPADLRPPT